MHSYHKRGIKRCCHAVTFGLLLLAFTVQAAEPLATASPQITRLQAQIDSLAKRLDKLEKKQHSADTNSHLAARPGLTALHEMKKLKTGWKKLQHGLSKTQLLQLLGDPDSKTRVNNQILWYYAYPSIGRGSVMFDYNGRVSAWQTPPF